MTKARAVVVREFGPPETFKVETIELNPPGEGLIRVSVKAAAVNFVDTLITSGRYQVKPPLPFIPGGEYAGIVDAVGDGVAGFRPGDRVCGGGMGARCYSEMLLAPVNSVYAIPGKMGFAEAATFRVSNATAYLGLVQRGNLKAGELVLVLGAGGGIGLAAIQIAKALGATVIASASTQAKRDLAKKAGADYCVEAGAPDWRDRVKAIAGSKGVDIVADPVGGEATEPAFRSLGWQGRHLVIGFAGGGIPALRTNLALVKGAALLGVDLRTFIEKEPQSARDHVVDLFALWEQGHFTSAPIKSFPIERFQDALTAVADRATAGRLVLDMTT